MTRPVETPSEVNARNALMSYLLSAGANPNPLNRAVNDRPDIAFEIEGRIVACECVQVPDHKILKWAHRKMAQSPITHGKIGGFLLIWPNELHSWALNAIKKKNNLISAYKSSVNASECWLLLHSDLDYLFENMDANDFMHASYEIAMTNHNFDRIYFYSKEHGVKLLYMSGMVFFKVEPYLLDGYPHRFTFEIGGDVTTTNSADDPPNIYEYEIEVLKEIIIPPIDSKYAMAGLNKGSIRLPTKLKYTAYNDRIIPEYYYD